LKKNRRQLNEPTILPKDSPIRWLPTYWTQTIERAANLRVELRQRGSQLGLIDAMIAVIALRYQLILLTTDQDFNAIAGLTIENWLL
jgi:predicted nucleic acid-binding protein